MFFKQTFPSVANRRRFIIDERLDLSQFEDQLCRFVIRECNVRCNGLSIFLKDEPLMNPRGGVQLISNRSNHIAIVSKTLFSIHIRE